MDEPDFGTAAGTTDIVGQRAVLPSGGIQMERVIVPWAERRYSMMGVSRPDALADQKTLIIGRPQLESFSGF